MISKGRVQDLTTSLNTTNKTIKKYVNNALLDNAAINGKWYGIPNNNIIGDYTFMLVNKELAAKYGYEDGDAFTSFGEGTAAADLINKIAENEDTSKIAPMYGLADYPLVKYWSTYGSDAASVLATMYANSTVQIGNAITAVNIF
jgi:ABC-type glycerol-3-phosphate transport system substrate-binding protein